MTYLTLRVKRLLEIFRLFKRGYGKYRWKILVTFIIGFLSGFSGSIGISIVIPLFPLATKQTFEPVDGVSRIIYTFFDLLHIPFNLPVLLSLMLLLFLAKAISTLVATYASSRLAGQYLQEMQSRLFNLTLRARWSYILDQKIGHLDRVITEDSNYASGILRQLGELMLRIATLITYAVVALTISLPITLYTLAGGLIIVLALRPLFYKVRKLTQSMSATSKQSSHHISESMVGIKTIKAFATEPAVGNKADKLFDALRRSQLKSDILGAIQGVIFEPLGFIFIAVIFIFYSNNPGFHIASFAVIIYLIQKMFSFVQAIEGRLYNINASIPYLENMLLYQDSARQSLEKFPIDTGFKFEHSVDFNNVTFKYPQQNKEVLHNITFSIKKGEMLGIIGRSGSGKTTLVDLLLHLLEPSSGTICIDNKPLMDISTADLRLNVGYVSQDTFLFNDTIEANIRFFNNSITSDEVDSAAKMAQVYEFINKLPNKFQTIVGDRGVKLSGGQRQRIALARVLARKPKILILDEATSSLDNNSERLIQEAIDNLKGKVTTVVIAHRLSTTMNSDRLIALDDGRLVEQGSPSELMKDKNSYLYKSLLSSPHKI